MQPPEIMSSDADCAVAIVYAGGQVLLGKRSPDRSSFPNIWDLFGGHVESGESAEQALVREVWEELGVTVTSYDIVGVSVGSTGTRYYVYLVSEWTGDPLNKAPEEPTEIRWCSSDLVALGEGALREYVPLVLETLAKADRR